MKISNLSFPYPVLGLGDDILPIPKYLGEPLVTTDAENYCFEACFNYDNPTISQLVDSGKATYVCEVNCMSTMFRRCFKSKEPHFLITIPRNCLGGNVVFQYTITVVESIASYFNPLSHEDYMGFSFDLEPGDLLGILGEFSYDVDIKYDKLKSVGSFMQITEGPKLIVSRFNLGGDKIDIQLPTEQYQLYKSSIQGNLQLANIIHSSIVFNALVTALLSYDDFQETLWARTLRYRVDTEVTLADFKNRGSLGNLDVEDVIELAQVLLSDPYGRLFTTLVSYMENDEFE